MSGNFAGDPLAEGMRHLHKGSGWIIFFGVVALLAGIVALSSVVMATASAVFIVGIMMILGGVAEIIASFGARGWGRFLFWLLLGIVYIFAGVICLQNPFQAATLLTLMLGVALIVTGLLRIFLGIDLFFIGTTWLAVGLALRRAAAT